MTILKLMRQSRVFVGHSAYTLSLIGILLLVWCPVVRADNVIVVASESVETHSLTRSQLRQIFTGHLQYWEDGKKIHVFVLEDENGLHKTFCRETLQMFPYQLSRLWDQLTYSGQGVTPTRAESQAKLIEMVESTSGAIGYVTSGKIIKGHQLEVRER
ncbi:substrate-binding domain-containing protein [Alteromonas sp. 1_MG-2023]|uniref:substrate-binding domain-containing protein n=1 Tax=Alteromonas sp. 1_MG-2023 TaxID=3062669 RepID=UPI0026E203D0|nr:substrate-binding domain-containing protein [Alteromonas sp. 1_MG-2023]MDO6566474.1 substrate-binding domain-containing protein [Alteromonas sp. 1_MG-2023]